MREVTKLMFDQYQRYETVSQIRKQIKKEKCKVLEIGSFSHRNLSMFLPDDEVVFSDIVIPKGCENDANFIQIDATNINLEDNSFDLVVALDVFEHIPSEGREAFISETMRVCTDAVIFSAPFDEAGVSDAEKMMNSFYKHLFGEEHRWLKEHIENKLPTYSSIKSILSKRQIEYLSFTGGSLEMWERLLRMHFISTRCLSSLDYLERVYKFYNENMFLSDIEEPCYRTFFVMCKSDEALQINSPFYKSNESKYNSNRNRFLGFEKSFYDIVKNHEEKEKEQNRIFTEKSVLERDNIIRKQENHIHNIEISFFEEKKTYEAMVKERDNIINSSSQHIDNLEKRINTLEKQKEAIEEYSKNAVLQRDKIIEESQSHIKNVEESLQNKDKHIENLQNTVENLQNTVENLQNTVEVVIKERDRLIGNYEQRIAETQNHVANLEQTINILRTEIHNKNIHINNITHRAEVAESEVIRITSSITYRISAKLKRSKIIFGLYKLIKASLRPFVKFLRSIKKGKQIDSTEEVAYQTEKLYADWIATYEPDERELSHQKLFSFDKEPLISIVTPLYNTPESYLNELIMSLKEQTYSNWQVCFADGGSKGKTKSLVKKIASEESRVRYKFLPKNLGIAGNTNEAIKLAEGEYIAFLDHDDTLAPFALYEVVKAINENPNTAFLYSDEDYLSENGKNRLSPFFKPDFSPDLLNSYNYLCHFAVVKKSLGNEVGWLRDGFNGAQDHDFILRLSEKTTPFHIGKVLYHWRLAKGSSAGNTDAKTYAYEAGKKALCEHLERQNKKATVSTGMLKGTYRVKYEIPENTKVSIIIPNRNEADTLSLCINTMLEKTEYPNYEIIIVENNSNEESIFELYKSLKEKDSRISVIEWKSESGFNYSAINNFAASKAMGDVFLFINNDVEITKGEWLSAMLEHACREEVGAVGPKLLYPDNTIQHGGVVLGIGGVAGHAHKYFPAQDVGYCSRLSVIQNYSAVSAACIMMRKSVYEEVGGFDEKYAVAFNDIDLCMKIRKKGYLIVWTPFSVLYHHESKSRGQEDTPEKQKRFHSEIKRFLSKWKDTLLAGDPYYSKNLTLIHENFMIRACDEINPTLDLIAKLKD